MSTKKNKLLTLCLVCDGQRVLLGMKKRGFGAGKWNGFGGKLMPGESVEAATKRELREESGIVAEKLEYIGVIDFEFSGNPEIQRVFFFRVDEFIGRPKEGEEMRPKWFALDKIPFEEMWPDDRYWMPLLLEHKQFRGRFLFDKDGKIIANKLQDMSKAEE